MFLCGRIFTYSVLLLAAGAGSANAAAHPQKNKPDPAVAQLQDEMQSLRQVVTAQQDTIRELREAVRRLEETNGKVASTAGGAASNADRAVGEAQSAQQAAALAQKAADHAEFSAAEAKTATALQKDDVIAGRKRIDALEGVLGRFRLGGDVRLRFEPILQDLTPDRFRTRLRVRFGVEGKLNEDVMGGFYLATGTVNDDPVSTNQTLTQFFTRKPIGLDRGWITYRPAAAKWLQLTGGKFQTTWQRTSLTIDPDLNPEGFSEKVSFDLKNNVFRNVSFTGVQLTFNEVAGSNIPVVLGNDSWVFGGQGSVALSLGKRVNTTLSGTGLNWRNTDAIVQAIVAKTLAGNRNTNATIGSGASTVYASKFLYADFMADTTVLTGAERWPLRLVLDFVTNPRAASSQRDGFWGEAFLGRLQDRSDLQMSYAFGRIEQDAVIAAFNESELRAPTNILQHKVAVAWLAQKNTTVSFTGWFGRTLNRNLQNAALPPGVAPGEQDPYVKRLQMDVIYKF